MSSGSHPPIKTEVEEISDADHPPKCCPHCQSNDYARISYYFRTLQKLGSPQIARRIQYESITWLCNQCETSFAIHTPEIPMRDSYMPEIKEYALYRVLTKGDSARRVGDDLRTLHQVEISEDTILAWIKAPEKEKTPKTKKKGINSVPHEFSEEDIIKDFSGVLGVDGTFKSVKAKKNEIREAETEPLLLHLTHLEDGRLVAYWQTAKPKKK